MLFGGFIEHFDDQIYGGLFEPGSPLADERGFRKDVIEAMKELKLSVVRWPGGCFASGYHWKDGVGHDAQARARPGLGRRPTRTPSAPTSSSSGAGWSAASRTSAPTPATARPRKCSEWVEYCNATQGEYAAQRKADGHAKPFNVSYWSIGNENWGGHEIGAQDAGEVGAAGATSRPS